MAETRPHLKRAQSSGPGVASRDRLLSWYLEYGANSIGSQGPGSRPPYPRCHTTEFRPLRRTGRALSASNTEADPAARISSSLCVSRLVNAAGAVSSAAGIIQPAEYRHVARRRSCRSEIEKRGCAGSTFWCKLSSNKIAEVSARVTLAVAAGVRVSMKYVRGKATSVQNRARLTLSEVRLPSWHLKTNSIRSAS